MARHFVEIELVGSARTTLYRFFGRGEWKVKRRGKWTPINAIYIPAAAMQIAASQCQPVPPPFLSETDIAYLCGGNT